MPVLVSEIFREHKLNIYGPIKWGHILDCKDHGIYIVSSTKCPKKNECISFKISRHRYNKWTKEAKKLTVQNVKPKYTLLCKELKQHWHDNENILYIGMSQSKSHSIGQRIDQLFKHKIGQKGPHTGGYWLKLLSNMENLNIYYSICDNPHEKEFKMLIYFICKIAHKPINEIENISKYLPFANLKLDLLKTHGIKNPTNKNTKKG